MLDKAGEYLVSYSKSSPRNTADDICMDKRVKGLATGSLRYQIPLGKVLYFYICFTFINK